MPAADAAQTVAAQVAGANRDITVQPAAMGRGWLVQVVETAVADPDTIHERRAEFEAAVAPFGGEYDGWGAPA